MGFVEFIYPKKCGFGFEANILSEEKGNVFLKAVCFGCGLANAADRLQKDAASQLLIDFKALCLHGAAKACQLDYQLDLIG